MLMSQRSFRTPRDRIGTRWPILVGLAELGASIAPKHPCRALCLIHARAAPPHPRCPPLPTTTSPCSLSPLPLLPPPPITLLFRPPPLPPTLSLNRFRLSLPLAFRPGSLIPLLPLPPPVPLRSKVLLPMPPWCCLPSSGAPLLPVPSPQPRPSLAPPPPSPNPTPSTWMMMRCSLTTSPTLNVLNLYCWNEES